jgi:flagellar hook-associated protein 2
MASGTSDIGLALLNSMGASQFDVKTMAQVLANADVAAQRTNLENKQQKLNYKLSGYDLLNQALSGFNSQVKSLLSLDTFTKKTITSSDESVISAEATGSLVSGTYQVEVQQLATNHTLATSTDFSSTADVVGEGTLSITIAGVQHDITIDSSNNTLEGIRSAVNSANIGVSATVVNTGGGYKLMFTADKSGSANAINISVTDTDGNDTDAAGLSQLINANMLETVPAQDAQLNVNGLNITRSTNVVEDVIDGVRLNLNAAAPGQIKTLTVAADTSDARQAVQDFVDLYNSLQDVFKILGSYDNTPSEEDPTSGALKGDSTLRMLKIAQPISGSGPFSSLADLGILTNRDGTLEFDAAKLDQALSANPEAVGKLFAASLDATDPLVQFVGSNDKTPEGTWDLFVSQAAQQATLIGSNLGTGAGANITLDGTNNTLQVTVDGTQTAMLNLAPGTYSKDQLASLIQNAINNDANVAAKGSKVQVRYDGTNDAFVILSEKYGSASKISLDAGTLLDSGVVGWTGGSSATGQDVGGQITDPVSGNSYTFTGQGKTVKVSDYALDGLPKGLEFTIDGSATGSRGTITFQRGIADQMVTQFTQWMSSDGVVGQKLDNLHKKEQEYAEQQEKIDARYERLELKYRIQFGQLQSVLSSMKQTQASLAAQLAALQPKSDQ